ncbi:hypothetical protein GDO81_024375 [Engystomops pustulosus]|uniref:Uncharacterized protein n=1 Tax=Engystomops pustulosus TaxID=76066 RepID=A0AAV6YJ88_ENGPU|nr:hypothetical protein GDO81_024375 [Engystomops pustulosus]
MLDADIIAVGRDVLNLFWHLTSFTLEDAPHSRAAFTLSVFIVLRTTTRGVVGAAGVRYSEFRIGGSTDHRWGIHHPSCSGADQLIMLQV